MSSNRPPPEHYYAPYVNPGNSANAQQNLPPALQDPSSGYQPYRPQDPAQAPVQQEYPPPPSNAQGSYQPYHPLGDPQQPPQPVYELGVPDQQPIPAIHVQEPTPLPQSAAQIHPGGAATVPEAGHVTHAAESDHDDLYDVPPPPGQPPVYDHPTYNVPVTDDANDFVPPPPVGSTTSAGPQHHQINQDLPPQYGQSEGSSVAYQPPLEGQGDPDESSNKLIHEIGNILITEGSTSHTGSFDVRPDLPPRYYEPEGQSLSYQPVQEGKASGAASDVAPGISHLTTLEKPPPLPPRRPKADFGNDDPSNPIHYTRDPHKLIAYLIPFPKPHMQNQGGSTAPDRFLIYTPPPPPLGKPAEGEKENRMHKIQRKWQEEVRTAKTSTAKTASWQGVKSKATKGIDWAMSQTVSSNLEFLNRIQDDRKKSSSPSPNRPTSSGAGPAGPLSPTDPAFAANTASTQAKIGLEEMVLVYPSAIPGSQEELRSEFVTTMLRSKSKAQRDAVIATGLLPVSFAIDVLATVIWPFGGLLEIDSVWAYSSIRGARTARATTKRLVDGKSKDDEKLKLTFMPSERLEVLQRYLGARCHERDIRRFPSSGVPPTETEVLEAIGWAPSQSQGETRNWEDEQWEVMEVKEDFKTVMKKGAREWDNWCKEWEKNPRKALKK